MAASHDPPAEMTRIPRERFDALARAGRFADGPWAAAPPLYGPWVPPVWRKVWGRLDDGRAVYAGGD